MKIGGWMGNGTARCGEGALADMVSASGFSAWAGTRHRRPQPAYRNSGSGSVTWCAMPMLERSEFMSLWCGEGT